MRAQTVVWGLLLLSVGCAKEPVASPPPPEQSAGGEPTTQPTEAMDRKMWHHFWDVADARDAVIAGKLAAVREPLLHLSKVNYGVDEVPQDWIPWIEEMQAEAERGAAAKTLEEAAHAVAAVAQRCGDCHRATRGGPEMEDDLQSFDAHGRTGLKGAMAQHVWAAEELWLGMTVPHHPSWAAGAKALSETPLPPAAPDQTAEPRAVDATTPPAAPAPAPTSAASAAGPAPAAGAPSPTETIDPAMREKLEAVRAMGARALAAAKPFELTQVYGALIARCGNCHASL